MSEAPTGVEAMGAVVPMALNAIEHYVAEALRLGQSREDVRRTLDLRIVEVVDQHADGDLTMEQVRVSLDVYVDCVRLLDQSHLVEASA